MILKFPGSFSEYSFNFFFFSKLIPFPNFCYTFSAIPQSHIDILSSFSANSSNFLSRIKLAQIFILGYLKIFLQFSEVIKNFFDTHIIFLKELSVSNFFGLNYFFILRFIKLSTKIPVFSKLVPKFHKFY